MLNYPDNKWQSFFQQECNKPYFKKLIEYLCERREKHAVIYPQEQDIFNCFRYTDKDNVKIVILGQDPYHQKGQAMGLSFSVPEGIMIPPSLKNIYIEIEKDIGRKTHNKGGDLTPWAKQGVLLLNSLLTVEDSKPMAHKGIGWETFTDNTIREISNGCSPCVFMLWGRPAQSKLPLIDRSKHLVLTAAHPSPLSAYNGFFGCHHFSTANDFLSDMGIEPISW